MHIPICPEGELKQRKQVLRHRILGVNPHEEDDFSLIVGGTPCRVGKKSLEKYPNPKAVNMTEFGRPSQ